MKRAHQPDASLPFLRAERKPAAHAARFHRNELPEPEQSNDQSWGVAPVVWKRELGSADARDAGAFSTPAGEFDPVHYQAEYQRYVDCRDINSKFRDRCEAQAHPDQDVEHEGVERAGGHGRDARRLTSVFTAAQLDSLSRALLVGMPAVVAAAAVVPTIAAAPLVTRDDLVEPMRHALALKHPLRVEVGAKRPPLITIVVTGRVLSDEQVDTLLREQVLTLLCGENRVIAGDDVRLVLDMRGLLACPRDVAVALVTRWGTFVACRCFFGGRVAIVMPQDAACALELQTAANEWGSAFDGLRYRIFLRARDVAAFMNEE